MALSITGTGGRPAAAGARGHLKPSGSPVAHLDHMWAAWLLAAPVHGRCRQRP